MDFSDPTTLATIATIAGAFFYSFSGGGAATSERNRHAIELAGFLKAEGFGQLGDVLTQVATGTKTGLLAVLKNCKETFRDPARRAVELDQVFEKQLAIRLADPIQCKRIAEAARTAQASVAPSPGA